MSTCLNGPLILQKLTSTVGMFIIMLGVSSGLRILEWCFYVRWSSWSWRVEYFPHFLHPNLIKRLNHIIWRKRQGLGAVQSLQKWLPAWYWRVCKMLWQVLGSTPEVKCCCFVYHTSFRKVVPHWALSRSFTWTAWTSQISPVPGQILALVFLVLK